MAYWGNAYDTYDMLRQQLMYDSLVSILSRAKQLLELPQFECPFLEARPLYFFLLPTVPYFMKSCPGISWTGNMDSNYA